MACSDDCTSIVLGNQDGKSEILTDRARCAGSILQVRGYMEWGVSRDGFVSVAGLLTGSTLFWVMKENCWQKQRRTLSFNSDRFSVSSDGKRIIVADQGALLRI